MQNSASLQRQSQPIAGVYTLLSRLWLREIDDELISDLGRDPLRQAFVVLGGVVPHESLDELAVEYCRLFIGPRDHLPPVQSVWQRAQLHSETTTSVRTFAEILGYEMPVGNMFDHLGIELDLMAHAILGIQGQSCEPSYEEIAGEFFRRHLTWPTPLLDAAVERSISPFYRSMVQITRDFLVIERSRWLANS